LSIVFVSCNPDNTNKKTQHAEFAESISVVSVEDSIIGTWVFSLPMFYSRTLKIFKDSTFTYCAKGCTATDSSEGRWRREGSYIILTSHHRYFKSPYPKIGMIDEKTGKLYDTVVSDSLRYGIGFSLKMLPEANTVYFDQEIMMVNRDTLFVLDKETFSIKEWFVRSEKLNTSLLPVPVSLQ
jgi:hypothetical protein